jgi:acid phosphatase type 7
MQSKILYRLVSLLVMFSLITCANLVVHASSSTAQQHATTLTFTANADAYVIASNLDANYGTATTLRVDNTPVTRSYLSFVVSSLNGAIIQSARLRVYANSANGVGYTVSAIADNSWSEGAVTYSNAPAVGTKISTSQPFNAGTWTEVDITSYVKTAGVFNMALTTSSDTNTSLASRESGANAPQLVITVATGSTTSPTASPTPSQTPNGGSSDILLLAGDICKHDPGATDYTPQCQKTGNLVRSIIAANLGAQVQTLGDNVNNDTDAYSYDSEYTDLYAPNWGSFLNVTHALVGNHDTYPPSGTEPYFSYFGSHAGPLNPGGYYSYNIGSNWHIIVLNAQCSLAGGCGNGAPQYAWLKADLAANTRKCVLAAWHQPRFTSGRHSDNTTYSSWWDLLYQYKVDIVANGHNHNYERFNLIDPQEQAAADGIREFIVGTGGAPGDGYTYAEKPLDPNEAIRNQTAVYGVLKLSLSDSSYSWKFLPVSGSTFTDSGSTACH